MKRVGIIVFFILLDLVFLHPINSGDFFHHLNSGRYIAQHHALPYTDDATFTAAGRPWVAYAWGSGLLFYFLMTTAGPNAISILFAGFGLVTVLYTYLTLRVIKTPQNVSLILTTLTASLLSLRFPTRPEILGPMFISVLIYFIIRDRKLTWKLPFLFALWSILYGASAVVGIAIMAVSLVLRAAVGLYTDAKQVKTQLPQQVLILAACFVASLINGFGLASFLYIFQIPKIGPHTGEWLPLWDTMNIQLPGLVLFYQYTVALYLGFTAIWIIHIVYSLLFLRKTLIHYIFSTGASLAIIIPFFANRFINLAPLLVVPFVGLTLSSMKGKFRALTLVCIMLMAAAGISVRFHNFGFGLGLESDSFQNKAVAYLKSHGMNGNIYETQELGAYVSWELPQSKIFIDTRDDLFQPLGIFDELAAVDSGKLPIRDLLKKYKANIVIGNLTSETNYEPLFYAPTWKLVFLTDGYFIAVRTEIAQTYALTVFDAVDPLRPDGIKPGMGDKALSQLQAMIAADPSALENRVRLITYYLENNNADAAKQTLAAIPIPTATGSQAPMTDLETELLKARVYLASRDCPSAKSALTRAEAQSRRQLIFFPTYVLESPITRYWGEYYGYCEKDALKAAQYLEKYLKTTQDPIERRQIEHELDSLHTI